MVKKSIKKQNNKPKKNRDSEDDVPCTEDLMREHGLLSRVLLIYEELIQRIATKKRWPVTALKGALWVIKNFIGWIYNNR